jgi:transposase
MRNNFYLGTMIRNNNYDDDFRRKVATLAAETCDVKTVAEITGVSTGSVYRWMKAYDTFKQYTLKKYKLNKFPQTSFVRKSQYDNQFRRTVVQFAMKFGTQKAASFYNVSIGSVDNWIKAFQNNHAYLNR